MQRLTLLLFAWIPLFVAIDPVGLVPLFLGMTEGVHPVRRQRISHQALATAAVVLVGFMFLGKLTFRVLGITVGDFKIAGGLILFVLASRDLVRTDGRPQVLPDDFGIVPLAAEPEPPARKNEINPHGKRQRCQHQSDHGQRSSDAMYPSPDDRGGGLRGPVVGAIGQRSN